LNILFEKAIEWPKSISFINFNCFKNALRITNIVHYKKEKTKNVVIFSATKIYALDLWSLFLIINNKFNSLIKYETKLFLCLYSLTFSVFYQNIISCNIFFYLIFFHFVLLLKWNGNKFLKFEVLFFSLALRNLRWIISNIPIKSISIFYLEDFL
jgi:hypothetical protein